MTVKETLIQNKLIAISRGVRHRRQSHKRLQINAGNFDSLIESADAFVKAIS